MFVLYQHQDNLVSSLRLRVSTDIRRVCLSLARSTPSLSGVEETWLDREMAEWIGTAVASNEFSRRWIVNRSSDCLFYTSVLSDILVAAFDDPKTISTRELFLWTSLATNILDPDTLYHSKRLDGRRVIRFAEGELEQIEFLPAVGISILRWLVAPGLSSKLD